MTDGMQTNEKYGSIQTLCAGDVPLTARLTDWMTDALLSDSLSGLMTKYDSPLNIICSDPMIANANDLREVANRHAVDLKLFFARKSNKCLEFVERAGASDIGIDIASENELRQTLDCGVATKDIICTAAIKSESLIDRCIRHEIVIAVDNADELSAIVQQATLLSRRALIAIRLGGFCHRGEPLTTRFGFDCLHDFGLLETLSKLPVDVVGIHFHLDGYDAPQRVTAIAESTRWIERLRELGHAPSFIDMGGGFPMSYLDDEHQWLEFWKQLSLALKEQRRPITYRNHGLGLSWSKGELHGKPNTYPYYQSPVRAVWFDSILAAKSDGMSVADSLRKQKLQLRCEPGRCLMDGCGMTLARVEFRKQNASGDWLIGLSMNRTQCRTTSDDFLVDPLLMRGARTTEPSDHAPISGYLVGAYCTEMELLTLRKLQFPQGVQRGDIVIFPNTAGYLMHFMESRSHQLPLATNLIWNSSKGKSFTKDGIHGL